ncbi:MAG TPA: FAD binding domain-containing protein [Anaerolineales bacterium]|nr:FAD binding domain-containing protein [Anaerolineales bacterium]
MSIWKNYHCAVSISDVLQALAASPGPARIIAGGTDLLLDLLQNRHPIVHTLVDVTSVPELNALEVRQEVLFIGAAVPLNKIVGSSLVNQHALALVEACDLIGGYQVRNTATLGGNVAHALPAGDGSIALLALDAQAEIASLGGTRQVPVEDLFLGPGHSALDERQDLILGFILPLKKSGQASVFRRVMRPQGVALPILNMAVWLERAGDRLVDLRLAVGPSGPRPLRLRAVESCLRGKAFTSQAVDFARQELLATAQFRTSPYRASADYRRSLASVLLDEVLNSAWTQVS